MSAKNQQQADADEAILRGSWLHEHHAPMNWVILTTEEIAAMRADLMALTTTHAHLRRALEEAEKTLTAIRNSSGNQVMVTSAEGHSECVHRANAILPSLRSALALPPMEGRE